jgi:hypothetical protein
MHDLIGPARERGLRGCAGCATHHLKPPASLSVELVNVARGVAAHAGCTAWMVLCKGSQRASARLQVPSQPCVRRHPLPLKSADEGWEGTCVAGGRTCSEPPLFSNPRGASNANTLDMWASLALADTRSPTCSYSLQCSGLGRRRTAQCPTHYASWRRAASAEAHQETMGGETGSGELPVSLQERMLQRARELDSRLAKRMTELDVHCALKPASKAEVTAPPALELASVRATEQAYAVVPRSRVASARVGSSRAETTPSGAPGRVRPRSGLQRLADPSFSSATPSNGPARVCTPPPPTEPSQSHASFALNDEVCSREGRWAVR